MTVKELKNILNGMDDDLEVLVADYDDDSNEETVFRSPNGCEKVEIGGKTITVIYFAIFEWLGSLPDRTESTGPMSGLPCTFKDNPPRVEPL